MEREQVLRIIEPHRESLEKLGVKSLELFGSVAINEATANIDVYFMVEFLME